MKRFDRIGRTLLTRWLHLLEVLLVWVVCTPLATATPAIDIAVPLNNYEVHPSLDLRHDPGGLLTLQQVLDTPTAFGSSARTQFPRCDCAVWTRFKLKNSSTHTHQVLLMNPWPYVNLIDMYVIHPDGAIDQHALGSYRRHLPGRIAHRYEVQALLVAPGETIDVITRHQSANAIHVGVNLFSDENFMDFLLKDAQVWGIFSGLVFALIVYNSFVGLYLKQKPFLIYVVHAVMLYLFTVFLMGESIVAWLKPILFTLGGSFSFVSSESASHVSRMLTTGVVVTSVWFAKTYFDLRIVMPRLSRLSTAWFAIAVLLMGAEILSIRFPTFNLAADFLLYFLPVFLFSWLGFAVFTVWQKLPGSRFYLAGSGSFVLLSMLQDAHWFGFDLKVFNIFGAYGIPIGFMLELVFLALALGVKVRHMKDEHDRDQVLLLEQARFSSVGQLVSGVVHQLKRPIIYAGTQLIKLEALMDRPLGEWKEALPQQLAEMRNTINFMDRTILDLYHFHTIDTVCKSFAPAEQIEQALRIITPLTTGSALQVDKTLLPQEKVNGFPNAFAHAVLIVLENAAQVLKDRGVPDPRICLVMERNDATLRILITDNAGGISTAPPERIFETGFSRRSKAGMGIGLSLAKRIIEEKMLGRMSVRNHGDGAMFAIELPLENK